MPDHDERGTPLKSASGDEENELDSSIKLALSSDLSSVTQAVEGLSLNHKQRRMPAATGETLVVFSSKCLDHVTPEPHQEHSRRLSVLCGPDGILRQDSRFNELRWLDEQEIKTVTLADMLRVHDWGYVKHLEERCVHSHQLDVDTHLCPASLEAAKMAAGAVCAAVDAVAGGGARNAFVPVRPPGHHAGPRGAVAHARDWRGPLMCSSGFCLLNNVAIGASYARHLYGRRRSGLDGGAALLRRVAIVDFDIHHGNGTEAIVRNLKIHEERLPLPGSWAPRTEEAYKPWLDEDDAHEVFFASVHLFNDTDTAGQYFYPCSGPSTAQEDEVAAEAGRYHIHNVTLEPMGPKTPATREKLTDERREALRRRASTQFRERVQEQLLPKLDEFEPDIIFVSAGFDGHEDDLYHHLHEDDYEWITRELVKIADRCAGGRIVSVLEGGYSIVPRQPAKKRGKGSRRMRPEPRKFGSLARSCAAHVAVLCEASCGHTEGNA